MKYSNSNKIQRTTNYLLVFFKHSNTIWYIFSPYRQTTTITLYIYI